MLKRVRVPEPVPAPFHEVSKPGSSGSGRESGSSVLLAQACGCGVGGAGPAMWPLSLSFLASK